MKCLEVLPNFTVLVQCGDEHNAIMGELRLFCEVTGQAEHIDTYRITPASFWMGMNRCQEIEVNFIKTLQDNSDKPIPANVLKELEGFVSKFGVITLLGNDALVVHSKDLLEEIKNSSDVDGFINRAEGNILFLQNTNVSALQEIFFHNFGHPIKYHAPKIKDYMIFDGYQRYVVKASSSFEALKSLYNGHPFVSEEDMRFKMKVNKAATQENIDNYIQDLLENHVGSSCTFEITALPFASNFKPVII